MDGAARVVVGTGGCEFRALIEDAVRQRYGIGHVVFIRSSHVGRAEVEGTALSEEDAASVAVTQFRCAWDETAEIEVRAIDRAFLVQVTYADDRYRVSLRRAS